MIDLENIPDVLTISELQQVLRIGRSTAYRLIRSRELQCVRVGRSIRIPKQYMMEYVQTQHAQNSSENTNGQDHE